MLTEKYNYILNATLLSHKRWHRWQQIIEMRCSGTLGMWKKLAGSAGVPYENGEIAKEEELGPG